MSTTEEKMKAQRRLDDFYQKHPAIYELHRAAVLVILFIAFMTVVTWGQIWK